jgi:hypothetical protein
MSKPLAKPSDDITGRPVRIISGKHAGKQGIARKAYRGRLATPDMVHVEQEGGHPGWYVAVLASDVEVLRDAR